MFVNKVKTNKGVIERGKFGVSQIDVDEEKKLVTYYTAGGNIFSAKLRRVLSTDNGYVTNYRNYHKNLY